MRHILLCLSFLSTLLIHAQVPTEVTLQASATTKVVLYINNPQFVGSRMDRVVEDFSSTLKKDLQNSGVFLLSSSPQVDKKNMKEQGIDWLLSYLLVETKSGYELKAEVTDAGSLKIVHEGNYQFGPLAIHNYAHILADDMVMWLTGERGSAFSKITFARQIKPGVKEIFQMDSDGENISQLTQWGSLTIAPSVAQDGRLLYVTYKSGVPEIWGQRSTGGTHERIFPNNPKDRIAFCSSPVWAPDGKRFAFVIGDAQGRSDIAVFDLNTLKVRKLTFNEGINTEPTWNPSGTQLAFTSNRGGGPQLFLMQDDGTNVRQLTFDGTYNASPSWSPLGNMIAFVSRFESKFDLFIFKLSDGKSYQITTSVSSSESPSWSPDGRNLVFIGSKSSGGLLYRSDLSGAIVLPVSNLGLCQSPVWSTKN